MVNALVISNNINFIKTLLNELNSNKLDIKITNIVTGYSNIIELLNSSDFRIVFVDDSVPKARSKNFFKIYGKKIISLSYSTTSKMINSNNLKLLRRLSCFNDLPSTKGLVLDELAHIGYKLKYKGTNYLADTISYILFTKNRTVDSLQTDVYPIIAKKYGKSVNNIKSSMTKATELMYFESDLNVLEKYFGCCIETRPTVKQVVYTVIGKL